MITMKVRRGISGKQVESIWPSSLGLAGCAGTEGMPTEWGAERLASVAADVQGCPVSIREFGAPGVTRTPGPQFRKLLLYPPELRGHQGLRSDRLRV